MGELKDKEWTNKRYKYHRERFFLSPSSSRWWQIWSWLADYIYDGDSVIDLGCGASQFLRLLDERGLDITYHGYDFSSEALSIGKEVNKDTNLSWKTSLCNLEQPDFGINFHNNHVFVMCETLEHIQNDLQLLNNLPTGAIILFSLPSFDAIGHVRHFKTSEDILLRYSSVISIDETVPVHNYNKKKPRKHIFAWGCSGVIR